MKEDDGGDLSSFITNGEWELIGESNDQTTQFTKKWLLQITLNLNDPIYRDAREEKCDILFLLSRYA